MENEHVPTNTGWSPDANALLQQYKVLQDQFAAQYESVFPDRMAPKAVVIVPSLTLDQQILAKVDGVVYYEERLLCLLMLLRMPNTHVIYLTSVPVDPVIIDYYLHLLPGITSYHARQRLTLLSCYDDSPRSLTQKILDRPRLLERIRKKVPQGYLSHLACFNVTEHEQRLAVLLGMPVYGCDPALLPLGTKSGSRSLFRACGLPVAPGYEDLNTQDDICRALSDLKAQQPVLRKAMVKINDGFSGDGNAVFVYPEQPGKPGAAVLKKILHTHLKPVATDLSAAVFLEKFHDMGGIVEIMVAGTELTSPSVQCRINPLGRIEIVSTHDQVLKGENKQVFTGATFPASPEYAVDIAKSAGVIAAQLRDHGVLGRFAIDFISVKEQDRWTHYPLEINLRKGGTTHPYLMLQFLTDGNYEPDTGTYLTAGGHPRYYFASDNLQHEAYRGLTPPDLIDIAMTNDLLYDGSRQEGVMFHLIGALSRYGKLGLVCIGASPGSAEQYHHRTLTVLDRETRK